MPRLKPAAPFVIECLIDPTPAEIREAKRRAFRGLIRERRHRILESTNAVDSGVSDLLGNAKVALGANPSNQYIPALIDALEEYQNDAAEATAAVGDDANPGNTDELDADDEGDDLG